MLPTNPSAIAPFSLDRRQQGAWPAPTSAASPQTQEMLDFSAEHGIAAEIETIGADQVNEAYDRVVGSDVRYRFVIDTATISA